MGRHTDPKRKRTKSKKEKRRLKAQNRFRKVKRKHIRENPFRSR